MAKQKAGGKDAVYMLLRASEAKEADVGRRWAVSWNGLPQRNMDNER